MVPSRRPFVASRTLGNARHQLVTASDGRGAVGIAARQTKAALTTALTARATKVTDFSRSA
jgi:hypothetical protein